MWARRLAGSVGCSWAGGSRRGAAGSTILQVAAPPQRHRQWAGAHHHDGDLHGRLSVVPLTSTRGSGGLRRPAQASVESPLQLLCAVEARHERLVERLTVSVRAAVPSLAEACAEIQRAGLPQGVTLVHGVPGRGLLHPGATHVIGDAFSGVSQSRLASPGQSRVVVVDDGMATLELARRLVAGEPLVRLRATTSWVRTAMGSRATDRLRRLASRGSLVLFTAMPLAPDVRRGLADLGVDVRSNHFAWLRSRPFSETPTEPLMIIGSAMVADGLIATRPYLQWVRELTATAGSARYFPHRRTREELLDYLRTVPGLVVDQASAPIEMRLRALNAGQQVATLPSTSAVLLTAILGDRATVQVLPVPKAWWTTRASAPLRAHLNAVVDLAAHASTQQTPESGGQVL